MAQTEITVQVFENIETIKQKILDAGYIFDETLHGKDRFFSTHKKEEIKDISFKELMDSSIIIREFTSSAKNEKSISLLHKLKTFDKNGNLIGEEKTRVNIENADTAHKLLENAGLSNWLILEQENNFFNKGEMGMILGTVEGLEGCFIEIEDYPSIQDKPEEERFEILKNYIDSFGFKMGPDYSCKKSLMLYTKNNK